VPGKDSSAIRVDFAESDRGVAGSLESEAEAANTAEEVKDTH
jgi:hypothetical protein